MVFTFFSTSEIFLLFSLQATIIIEMSVAAAKRRIGFLFFIQSDLGGNTDLY
jgi:hypothetical protein